MARISKAEKEVVRSKIVSVARELFLDSDYDHVSTKNIAKKVGIAEGTLFNYFDSKSEIFFESIALEVDVNEEYYHQQLLLESDISKAVLDHTMKFLNYIVKIPKGILGELAIASLKMAKKRPESFQKLIKLDFEYMEELTGYFRKLIEKGFIKKVDPTSLSEIMYSVFAFELMMYLYKKDIDKEELIDRISNKIDIILKEYILEENHD